MSSIATDNVPDARGHFGPYGGRYVPETLMHPLQELEVEYARSQQDPEFQREYIEAIHMPHMCDTFPRLNRSLAAGRPD